MRRESQIPPEEMPGFQFGSVTIRKIQIQIHGITGYLLFLTTNSGVRMKQFRMSGGYIGIKFIDVIRFEGDLRPIL